LLKHDITPGVAGTHHYQTFSVVVVDGGIQNPGSHALDSPASYAPNGATRAA